MNPLCATSTYENLAHMTTKGLSAEVREKLGETLMRLVDKVALQQRKNSVETIISMAPLSYPSVFYPRYLEDQSCVK